LWRILQANGGMPADAVVCFANTGKEEEATLRFVRDCQRYWAVPIHWLEYRLDAPGFAEVDFDRASREGEPFELAIRHRRYLPNPITRFCTSELKIRTMHKYLRGLGWEEWDQCIGIRADEERRVAKIRNRGRSTETKAEEMVMPLADARVTVGEVREFWKEQAFDLGLKEVNGRTFAGNCDLCFLKPPRQRLALIRERPERAVWWIRMEQLALSDRPLGQRFTKDEPSYQEMAKFAQDQGDFFGDDREALPCFCGD
jgi:3'-phosphoadenosine 5'-phosphosulfate sulfotransferase (PAPS reductase)/FAD synthetase